MVAFCLMAGGFVCLLLGHFLPALFLMSVLYGIGNGVGTVSAPLIISATFGKKNFNLMRGITQSPMQLGMSLGGLMLAFTYDTTGTYTMGWSLCIVLCAFSSVCFMYAYKAAWKQSNTCQH